MLKIILQVFGIILAQVGHKVPVLATQDVDVADRACYDCAEELKGCLVSAGCIEKAPDARDYLFGGFYKQIADLEARVIIFLFCFIIDIFYGNGMFFFIIFFLFCFVDETAF
jgi:hypothetical protein